MSSTLTKGTMFSMAARPSEGGVRRAGGAAPQPEPSRRALAG